MKFGQNRSSDVNAQVLLFPPKSCVELAYTFTQTTTATFKSKVAPDKVSGIYFFLHPTVLMESVPVI